MTIKDKLSCQLQADNSIYRALRNVLTIIPRRISRWTCASCCSASIYGRTTSYWAPSPCTTLACWSSTARHNTLHLISAKHILDVLKTHFFRYHFIFFSSCKIQEEKVLFYSNVKNNMLCENNLMPQYLRLPNHNFINIPIKPFN